MSKLQKWQPFIKNSVENATPSSEIEVVRYKMQPLREKLHRCVLAKCTCPPAVFLSNKLYSRCLISTRAWAAGWLGAWLAGRLDGWLVVSLGHQNASKRVALARNSTLGTPTSVKNDAPSTKSVSKMRPLRQ